MAVTFFNQPRAPIAAQLERFIAETALAGDAMILFGSRTDGNGHGDLLANLCGISRTH